MRALKNPSTVSNSEWSHGHPNVLQWETVSAIVDSLAAYIREEPTTTNPKDFLTQLAADQAAAEKDGAERHEEHMREDGNV
jgi:hypothetical protein